jgi:hypothetical protein
MAGLTLDPGSDLFSSNGFDLLFKAIGGTQDENTVNNSSTAGTQATTGSTNTTGTTADSRSGLSQTRNYADVGNLQKVFDQQQQGITPDVLAAIFSEGAKAAPGLVNATANAVGARSSNNTPLATALTQLSSLLTNQAATLSLDQRNKSGQTAEAIARLTSGTDVMNSETANRTAAETGTNTSNQTSTNNTNQTINRQTDSQPNYGNVTKLLGLLLGSSAVNNGLGDVGGISGLLKSGTEGVGGLIKQLIGGAGNSVAAVPGSDPAVDAQENAPENNMGPMADFGLSPATSFDFGSASLEELLQQPNWWDAINLDAGNLDALLASPNFFGNQTLDQVLSSDDWWSSEGWDSIVFGEGP